MDVPSKSGKFSMKTAYMNAKKDSQPIQTFQEACGRRCEVQNSIIGISTSCGGYCPRPFYLNIDRMRFLILRIQLARFVTAGGSKRTMSIYS